MLKNEVNAFYAAFRKTLIFSLIISALSFSVSIFLPIKEVKSVLPVSVVQEVNQEADIQIADNLKHRLEAVNLDFNKIESTDEALELYKQSISRSAVEWFYSNVTGSEDVASAILTEAEKNNIPISLAFSLAYAESRYNTNAVNKNKNATIDRGLFQLNNESFPQLSEEEFFNPLISAKYGMSHLRFCMNTAGNTISALAMYNAGTNKVRSNKTPQSTLNYVSKIIAYQDMLEKLFADEVLSYYENIQPLAKSSTIAFLNDFTAEK